MATEKERNLVHKKFRWAREALEAAEKAWNEGDVVTCHRYLDGNGIRGCIIYVTDLCRSDLMRSVSQKARSEDTEPNPAMSGREDW